MAQAHAQERQTQADLNQSTRTPRAFFVRAAEPKFTRRQTVSYIINEVMENIKKSEE